MASVIDWVDDMRVEVPSALEPTMLRAARSAIQEFFRDSEAWRYKEDITLEPGVKSYELSLPSDTYILAADYARVHKPVGKPLALESVLAEDLPHHSGSTTSYACERFSVLFDSVNEDSLCTVGVVLQPDRFVDEVPDELTDKFFDIIRSGALYRLMAMRGKDWSNIEGSRDHERLFREGVAKAKREAKRERSRPKKVVRFNRDFCW